MGDLKGYGIGKRPYIAPWDVPAVVSLNENEKREMDSLMKEHPALAAKMLGQLASLRKCAGDNRELVMKYNQESIKVNRTIVNTANFTKTELDAMIHAGLVEAKFTPVQRVELGYGDPKKDSVLVQ